MRKKIMGVRVSDDEFFIIQEAASYFKMSYTELLLSCLFIVLDDTEFDLRGADDRYKHCIETIL